LQAFKAVAAPSVYLTVEACCKQEMDLAAAAAGVTAEPDMPTGVDGVIETVIGADGAARGAPVEELSEEEILANQRLKPGGHRTGTLTLTLRLTLMLDLTPTCT
jgi:hypothetical protein